MHLKHLFLLSFFLLSFSVFSVKGQIIADADRNNVNLNLVMLEDKKQSESVMMTDSLLNFASGYLNTPYRIGANGTSCFDCSGFSSYVYKNFGYALVRTAAGQAQVNGMKVDKNSVQRGDLVFFKGRDAKQNRVGHVGIIYEVFPDGTFSFIHASCKRGVTINKITDDYYSSRYVTAKRIFEGDDDRIQITDRSCSTSDHPEKIYSSGKKKKQSSGRSQKTSRQAKG